MGAPHNTGGHTAKRRAHSGGGGTCTLHTATMCVPADLCGGKGAAHAAGLPLGGAPLGSCVVPCRGADRRASRGTGAVCDMTVCGHGTGFMGAARLPCGGDTCAVGAAAAGRGETGLRAG